MIPCSRCAAPVFVLNLLWLCPLSAIAQSSPQPVRAAKGMVVSADTLASQVGADILKRGGNAVDAAVATALALAVTYPVAGNLGGGGFMLVRMANGGCVAIDYRETAPAAAQREMYLDRAGNVLPDASLVGGRAAGVPGTVAGLALALEKYGTLPWAKVVEPARRLAAEGFPVSYALARSLRLTPTLNRFEESKRIFLRNGKFYTVGEKFRQPELAATLRRLQLNGAKEFYTGKTAQAIIRTMQKTGGLITRDDLLGYRAKVREPLHGTYRGIDVYTMPPPSSGGIALLEGLNILEQFDLAKQGYNSTDSNHLLIETMRRIFADRAEFPGDPDFVKIPVRGLISKAYAKALARGIDLKAATPLSALRAGKPAPYESEQTTHFSVVDAKGNAVSNTYTLNGGYGSAVTVEGAGFLLNNEMDDFTSKPGVPNGYGLIQGEANAIAPNKRPLSSMTPTILVKNGKLFLIAGSPGGPTIISTVLQVIVNIVDYQMNAREAVSMPRLHHQWQPDVTRVEAYRLSRDSLNALKTLGHRFEDNKDKTYWGDAEIIMVEEDGMRAGGTDPRSSDAGAIGHF